MGKKSTLPEQCVFENTCGDYTKSSGEPSEDEVIKTSKLSAIKTALEKIGGINSQIMQGRYFEGLSLEQLCSKFNLPKERIREIIRETISHLSRLLG